MNISYPKEFGKKAILYFHLLNGFFTFLIKTQINFSVKTSANNATFKLAIYFNSLILIFVNFSSPFLSF